jgi:DNA polymerase-3 subunit gamma/tau
VAARKRNVEQTEPTPGVPLNRKYRPQSFDSAELVGQEHIVRTLKNAIRNDRIAQAYLFCGPRGTGKTSTARILAKAVNCLDPDPDKRPCNVCASCVAINSGATADVIEIDAASNRGIDDIRDLRERVTYAPTQLRKKFYIIDEAHQITGAAANAFLKTLEEPPPHVVFVLATTDPEELPATILSRCQRFDFRRHTTANIASRVRALAEREGIALSDEAVSLVADLAHGSMRDPIGLLDQLANYHPTGDTKEIGADDVRALVGMSGSETAVEILGAIADRNAVRALEAIQASLNAGQDPRQLNRQLTGLIRSSLYLASGASVPTVDDDVRAIAGRMTLPDLMRIAANFTETESEIRSAVMPQLPLELAVLRSIIGTPAERPARTDAAPVYEPPARREQASAPIMPPVERTPPPPAPDLTPKPPVEAGSRLADKVRERTSEPLVAALAEPAPVVETPAPPADAVVPAGPENDATIEAIRDAWSQIRADVKSLDRRTEALLMEIDPYAIQDGQVVLASPYDFHRNMLNDPDRRAILEQVIHRRFNVRLRVSTALRSELVAQPSAPTPAPKAATPTAPGETPGPDDDEKYLNAIKSTFDGEVLEDLIQ